MAYAAGPALPTDRRAPGLLVILAVVALAMGIGADLMIRGGDHIPHNQVWAVFNAALGASFVGTGLYAWWRAPANRTGGLLVWVGFTFFLSAFEFSNEPALFLAGQFTDPLPTAALLHLVLAFPNGRLESRYHRGLVAVGYLNATLFQVPGIFFYDSTAGCANCPGNPLLIVSKPDLYNAVEAFVNLAAVSVIALAAREVIAKIIRARRVERQIYSIATYAGVATLVAFAALFASHGFGGPGADALRYLANAMFVAVPFGFLGGLARGRVSRAYAVADLIEAVENTHDKRTSLRDSLAVALGDSSLELAYWIPEQEAYFGPDGRRVELPTPGSGRAATPIARSGAPLAVVLHDESLSEERDLVRTVGAAAALTLENERLDAERLAGIEELRASRTRIVQAADEERQRLERDLHDGAQQRLVALALNLRLARAAAETSPDACELIDDAIAELAEATAELRELARGIHPAVLTQRGLVPAVTALATRAPIPVEVRGIPAERFDTPVEATAYFVVAEALTNVARYSQASYAEVAIDRNNGSLVVDVRDDGTGGADPSRGSGLRGLADRVASVDGRLVVTSEPGAGTVVHAEIPCAR